VIEDIWMPDCVDGQFYEVRCHRIDWFRVWCVDSLLGVSCVDVYLFGYNSATALCTYLGMIEALVWEFALR
jgi:hypothetical protein